MVLPAVAAAVAMALSPGVSAAEPEAAEGKSLVVMGDSYTANGTLETALGDLRPGRKPDVQSDCPHAPTSWPTQLGQSLGLTASGSSAAGDVVDVSCRGGALVTGPGVTVVHQTNRAVARGAFGPRTKAVLIQAGINDAWGDNDLRLRQTYADCVLDMVRGCGPEAAAQGRAADYRGLDGPRYAERLRAVVVYLHYIAPQARIVLVGYPETAPTGAQQWCVNIGGASAVQPRAGAMVQLWDRMDAAQRDAARILGVEFFDTRAATAGHGLCSPQPWIAGYLDPRSDWRGEPLHPIQRSDAAIAAGLRQLLTGGAR
ncbi:MAG: SGNH/GDSL hydrolase family protein [Mycobacteriaceae bacterium]|nr:SGNH/GDSL hydrolase family protein [Mycobacteriaceae bacterium]